MTARKSRQKEKSRPRQSSVRRISRRRERPGILAAQRRGLRAIAFMREGYSLTKAARAAETTSTTVRHYFPTLLSRDRRGRFHATPTDQMREPMKVLTPAGTVTLDIRGSHSRSRLGTYMNAVKRAMLTGDTRALRPFRGQAIRVGKVAYPFITHLPTLRRLYYAGQLHVDDIYETV